VRWVLLAIALARRLSERPSHGRSQARPRRSPRDPAPAQGDKGTPADKLRLALVQLLTCEALPGEPDFDRATAALAAAGADPAALAYVRRMRRMNLTGRSAAGAAGGGGGGGADGPAGGGGGAAGGALAGLAGQSHLLSWADKTFGQGLSSLTKGARPGRARPAAAW